MSWEGSINSYYSNNALSYTTAARRGDDGNDMTSRSKAAAVAADPSPGRPFWLKPRRTTGGGIIPFSPLRASAWRGGVELLPPGRSLPLLAFTKTAGPVSSDIRYLRPGLYTGGARLSPLLSTGIRPVGIDPQANTRPLLS